LAWRLEFARLPIFLPQAATGYHLQSLGGRSSTYSLAT
jgi:hypothetical protein